MTIISSISFPHFFRKKKDFVPRKNWLKAQNRGGFFLSENEEHCFFNYVLRDVSDKHQYEIVYPGIVHLICKFNTGMCVREYSTLTKANTSVLTNPKDTALAQREPDADPTWARC